MDGMKAFVKAIMSGMIQKGVDGKDKPLKDTLAKKEMNQIVDDFINKVFWETVLEEKPDKKMQSENILPRTASKAKEKKKAYTSSKPDKPNKELNVIFEKMRRLSREYEVYYYDNTYRSLYGNGYYGKSYEKNYLKQRASLFVKQGKLLADLEEAYEWKADYRSTKPFYGEMDNRQLRTYITWRTGIRRGVYQNADNSYFILYLSEIVNNIGIKDRYEGLQKLFFLWNSMRAQGFTANDSLFIAYIKAYYVCNNFRESFKEAVAPYREPGQFEEYFIDKTGTGWKFLAYDGISSYKISKSKYYTKEREEGIALCFEELLGELDNYFKAAGKDVHSIIYQKLKDRSWIPFSVSFYEEFPPKYEKFVYLQNDEYYFYNRMEWKYRKEEVNNPFAKLFLGYIMKSMEKQLRELTDYKYKLTTDKHRFIHDISHEKITKTLYKLLSSEKLDEIIKNSVLLFLSKEPPAFMTGREQVSPKEVVLSIDTNQLNRIREESLEIQDKLSVGNCEEAGRGNPQVSLPVALISEQEKSTEKVLSERKPELSYSVEEKMVSAKEGRPLPASEEQEPGIADQWAELAGLLKPVHFEILNLLLQTSGNAAARELTELSKKENKLVEVLYEEINEAALEVIGDNLLDMADLYPDIYEDYQSAVRNMLKELEDDK
ncbi:TerB-C domain-containing protein [Anaerocolumna jejuensis DSM 15929]|uniref:TerB-C domain-containing protein n=1 Tax=Anaerocolumna jejuensis DSM 15929 TaxID=1121322 RepID=A0A1M6UE96_9FIRM|nr:TerB N-terminal domain-containing protein [Anaerocolumna jejuensis]SHK67509.1 TerB-C domain-containing protein [Anaerocolumna jejuensis DSM 15929]